jgi:hypothetical protein
MEPRENSNHGTIVHNGQGDGKSFTFLHFNDVYNLTEKYVID